MSDVRLSLRGRGERSFRSDERLLVSAQGQAPADWCSPAQIRPGDFVGVTYAYGWPIEPAALPALEERPLRGSEKVITTPSVMTNGLAFFLGAYLSEGHTTRSNWSVIVTNSVQGVLLEVQRCVRETSGLHARLTHQKDRCPGLVVSSKRLIEFMDELGCGSRAANKCVPSVILNGTRAHALRFLQGAALDAYTTHTQAGKWGICLESQRAIDALQDVITMLGVVNAQIPKFNRQMHKTYYELYAPGPWGQTLSSLVPFLEPDKARRAAEYRSRAYRSALTDRVPGVNGRELYESIPCGRSGRSGRGSGRQSHRNLLDRRTRFVTRESVLKARRAGAHIPRWLEVVLDQEVRFAEVKSVEAPADLRGRSLASNSISSLPRSALFDGRRRG